MSAKPILETLIHPDERTLVGIIMSLAAAVGFSLLGVIAKLAYNESVTVEQMLFLRSVMCLIIFWVLAILMAKESRIRSVNRAEAGKALIAGIFGQFLVPFTGLMSINYIGASPAGLLFSVYPVFVIIIDSIIIKKLPSLRHVFVLIMTLIGIYLVMGGGSGENLLKQNFAGSMWGIASGLFSGIYVILNQRFTKKMDSISFMAYCIVGGLFFISIYVFIFTDISFVGMKAKGIFYIAASAIIYSLSIWMFSRSIKRIGATRTSLISNISPVLLVIFAYMILGEILTLLQLMGGAMVIAAILFLERRILVVLRRKKSLDRGLGR